MTLGDDLFLPLHGPTAACHDLHTGRPGSFSAAMRTLAEAREAGRTVLVWSWLTRSTCRSLVSLVDRLCSESVTGWAIVWPPGPSEGTVHSRTVSRLGIAVPHALRAIDRAHRRSLPARIHGVPLCALGPFAAWRTSGTASEMAEVCEGCPSRPECPGVDPWYLARHGTGELRPTPLVPRDARGLEMSQRLERVVQAALAAGTTVGQSDG
ncbi:MAG: hypothetical protein K0V04_03830 [Deltaproteobacteria bacterium]|nr:hypothetical protein [Deltaproteobacteria bacterium]